jgi:predicted Fe-Mo cluster-binding NifX family protein
MKIAIPITDGKLSSHFGHCERFAVFSVKMDQGLIKSRDNLLPPRHEPGVLPRWLHELGVNVIIAGGMGSRAKDLFLQDEITVVLGAGAEDPERLIEAYLGGELETGPNTCDH